MKFQREKLAPILVLGALVLLSMVSSSCTKQGDVIETIGGHSIYTEDYENYYKTSVNLASRMAGADESLISRMVCNSETAIGKSLTPAIHYTRYRDSLMVAKVAEEEGFLDDPNVKRMLEQSRLQTISQLYINAKLLQSIKIPEEAKMKVCEALRKKEPKKMASLSLDDCLEVAEGALKRRLIGRKSDGVINSIRESIAIKKNDNFDLGEYLGSIALYKKLRKKGGCNDSASGQKEEKQDKSKETEK